jgi:hypothetical protein
MEEGIFWTGPAKSVILRPEFECRCVAWLTRPNGGPWQASEQQARMAELVDASDSKSGYRKVVQVRFLFRALKTNKIKAHISGPLLFLSQQKANMTLL